ncbi:Protein hipA [hydrothermal vent metagenome]|uniref:Protein hipA n=1 Tax=hydrothermal vent metagenome TaxID=652676 RepID=A0A3B0T5S1_9ZZZZ
MTRPSDAKLVDRASVYKQDVLAGTITRTETGNSFQYSDAYLGARGPAVASTLPVRARPYVSGSGSLPPFFTGLLPEGARLDAVIAAVGTSADDELSLLLAVGADTVGDVQVAPYDAVPQNPPQDLPSDPTTVRFRDLLARTVDPLAERLDSALPGVQDKISDSMISFPVKRSRLPGILKLDPSAYPLITRNEHFFLSMARTAGFVVPDHDLVVDTAGEVGLLIARFDRVQMADRSTERIGQEDACQLLGRYPADKYRVTVNDIADRVSEVATAPRAAILDLVLQVAFAWMIGNGDLHAKNYSLQWRLDGIVAATPLYDIVSTLAYPINQRMALHLDGRDDNFTRHHFVEFAGRFDIPERLITRRLDDMVRRSEPTLGELAAIGYDDDTTTRLDREIRRRMDTLRAHAS